MQAPPSQSAPARSGALPEAGGGGAAPACVVLAALALPAQPERPSLLLPQVSAALAALMGWPIRPIAPGRPPQALADLTGSPGPWLAPLPADPGVPLEGGSWAEHLGAWRQPTLLVIDAEELATGLPAAAAALLERWRVPLLGLLQWRGAWQEPERRGDGLPWLGQLQPLPEPDAPVDRAASDAAAALRLRLILRWQCLAEGLA